MNENNKNSFTSISEINSQFTTIVSPLIGHRIGLDHIHTDEQGYYYYIPAKSLQSKHPIIMNHYRGALFMVIPYLDMKELCDGNISVKDYVETSFWSFGYYWGGGNMLTGAHWQLFSEERGIHETEKISRYLTILGCRTNRVSSGYMPSEDHCNNCKIDNCPLFTKHEAKYGTATWDNVKEQDDRIALYKAAAKRIDSRFGLKAVFCLANEESDNTILMFPSYEKDTVTVYLPQSILIDMMYHPGKYDIDTLANSLCFELGIPSRFGENDTFIPSKIFKVPEDADIQFFYDYWREDVPTCKDWFETKKVNSDEVDTSTATKHKLSFIEIFKKLF